MKQANIRPDELTASHSVDGGRYFYGRGERSGMQPGRAEASPINPKKLVVSPVRTLCRTVSSLPSRIVTVAVNPDTSGTPGGTLSIAIRTGTRWARRTQV
jgi:hypothetical protein